MAAWAELHRLSGLAMRSVVDHLWPQGPRPDSDTSILHHAFISIFIALWAVITHYISILMAILPYFTRFTMKRENAGSWNSGLEKKEQTLETYSAQLQKT